MIAAVLVGRVLDLPEPHGRVRHRLVCFVDHAHDLAGGARGHDRVQPALADQRPAALAAADEVDHVHAGLDPLRGTSADPSGPAVRSSTRAAERVVVTGNHSLRVRHQTVEVDVGVDLAAEVR